MDQIMQDIFKSMFRSGLLALLGCSAFTAPALAQDGKLEAEFLENWWYVLSNPQKSRYLALTTDAFHALPPPDPSKPNAVPSGVTNHIKAIESQRKSWYTIKPRSSSIRFVNLSRTET